MPRKLFPTSVIAQRTAIPYWVLLSSLLLTALITVYIDSTAKAKNQIRFDNAAQRVQNQIQDRLKTYIALLQAGSGLFATTEEVDQKEFRVYATQLNLRKQYPSIQGIGFSQRIPAAQKEAVVARMRQDNPTFTIRPDFERQEYHTIVYLEPLDQRNQVAIGFDMFTEPVRRAAMEQARDTATPTASGRVTLVQEIDAQKQAGFLIYLPVYAGGTVPATVAERRAALRGFIYSPFRADDFVQGIFGNRPDELVDFEIYDGAEPTAEGLLHRSNPTRNSQLTNRSKLTTSTTLDVAGRRWTILFQARPALKQNSEQNLVPFIALAGGIISFVLFAVTQSQVQARLAAERSEQSWRDSEERFQAFMNHSPTSAWITDRQGCILYLSQTYHRMFNLPQQAIGKTVDQLYEAEFADQFLENIRIVADQNQVVEAIETAPRPDGTVGEFLVYKFPIIDPSGECLVGGVAIDVTERNRAEAEREHLLAAEQQARSEAEASEQRFRFLAESIPQIVWVARPDGFTEYFNQRWFQYTGLTLEQTQTSKGHDFRHPDDQQRCLEQWQKASAAKEVFQVEQRFRRADGVYRWHLTRAHPMLNDQGEVIKWFGTCTDIDDRKRAEEALRQTNERLELLSKTASGLLLNEQPQEFIENLLQKLSVHLGLEVYLNYLLNADHERLQLHAYRGISAHLAKQIEWMKLGQTLCGQVAQQQQPLVRENVLQSTEQFTEFIRSIGINAYACYPLMAQGQLIGTLSFGTRKRSKFTADELELMQVICNQVATALERSRLITQLQQQTEELAGANRRKDEFLAILSHELRSPLNPILGWVKLLREGNLSAAVADRALETIERNARLQTQLIEDLLDVSRILRGKLSLTIAPVNLASVVEAALETMHLAAEAKSIQIQTQIEPEVGQVLGDAARLQQVVWNLLSNAIKFTPQEGQVKIQVERVGTNAQIQVIDTGRGIEPEFLPYVFDSFRQADSTTTRLFGGLGLGLAIVRHLVELHGGTVHVASSGENKGATFVVQLPLQHAEKPTDEVIPRPVALPSSSTLAGLQILVVDDESDMREYLTFVLEQHGAQVTTAATATAALQNLAQLKPDILLSDISMPEIDGYMMLRQIRALTPEQGGKTPAIALTAYAGEVNQQQALSAGFEQHLSKPVEPEALVKAIVHLVQKTQTD